MRSYEMVLILQADLEDHKMVSEEIAEVVRGLGAELEKVDIWGKKRVSVVSGELANSGGICVPGNIAIWYLSGHPQDAFAPFTPANKLHDPGFFGVADAERLAAAGIPIFGGKVHYDLDGFFCSFSALKGYKHQAAIVDYPFGVNQFHSAAKRGFSNANFVLIYMAHHRIGSWHLRNFTQAFSTVPFIDGDG